MDEGKPFIKRNRCRIEALSVKCIEGYKKYSADKNNWCYNLENEQYPGGDCETSYLSQLIFTNLYKKYINDKYKCPQELKSSIDTKGSTCMSAANYSLFDGKCYHYDIMHNPKETKHKTNRLGNLIKINDSGIYHSVGNVAPIPWVIGSNNRLVSNRHFNLQTIHLNKNEWWHYLLKYLSENWDKVKLMEETELQSKVSPKNFFEYTELTFSEYMIMSFQQLYYHENFNLVKEKIKKENIDNINWNKLLIKLNKNIRDCKEHKLITFDGMNIIDVKKDIELLIELRGRCILYFMNENNLTEVEFV